MHVCPNVCPLALESKNWSADAPRGLSMGRCGSGWKASDAQSIDRLHRSKTDCVVAFSACIA